jgi:hypothetical protein
MEAHREETTMIRTPAARVAVAVVIVASVAGAIVRVVTASDRVRERRETARVACANAGGEWVKLGNDELCRPRRDPTSTF